MREYQHHKEDIVLYKVINRFFDKGLNREFGVGDTYPDDDVKKDRLEQLSSKKNSYKQKFIEKVSDDNKNGKD